MLYMAPEIFEKEGDASVYEGPVDMWAAGVIMYQLVSGKVPFSTTDLREKVLNDEPSFYSSRWSPMSHEAKDLCRKLLDKSPVKRITAKDALKHPFFEILQDKKESESPELKRL